LRWLRRAKAVLLLSRVKMGATTSARETSRKKFEYCRIVAFCVMRVFRYFKQFAIKKIFPPVFNILLSPNFFQEAFAFNGQWSRHPCTSKESFCGYHSCVLRSFYEVLRCPAVFRHIAHWTVYLNTVICLDLSEKRVGLPSLVIHGSDVTVVVFKHRLRHIDGKFA